MKRRCTRYMEWNGIESNRTVLAFALNVAAQLADGDFFSEPQQQQ